MSWLTLTIIAAVLIVCAGLYVVGTRLAEFENGFVYFAYGVLALLLITAIYLAYASPSIAELNTRGSAGTSVTEQESNLLDE